MNHSLNSHSLNEIGGMCKRAARGAGLSWGLADDAANGARWLGAFDLPGPRLLAARLDRFGGDTVAGMTPVTFEGAWHGAGGRLCPIIAGATLSDRSAQLATDGHIDMRDVAYPLLCCPFAADAALSLGTSVRVEWRGVQVTMDGHRLLVEGDAEHLETRACERLRCSIVARTLPLQAVSPRIRAHVDADSWARLSVFAGRTYAPSTEESRRLGAGGADDG